MSHLKLVLVDRLKEWALAKLRGVETTRIEGGLGFWSSNLPCDHLEDSTGNGQWIWPGR